MNQLNLENAFSRIRSWRENPAQFVHEVFQADPEPWQIELLNSMPDPSQNRIAMQACKGVGKTTGLAWCIWNFLLCYSDKGEHPKGVATSITEDNIDDNLWPELAKWQSRSEFLKSAFTWKKERIYSNDHPETWFFSKRTWPKSGDKQQQANTLAGLHAKYLLFVLDESGGIPDAVMAAAEGGLATMQPGHWLKIIQAGNPTHLEGPLYRAATSERDLWKLLVITGDPNDPKRCSRQSKDWSIEQIKKYGRENPWVLVNVFGQFPPSSLNTLLGPDEVEAAMHRKIPGHAYDFAQKRLGVDVARFGDDRTVIFPRQGLMAFKPVEMRGARTNEIAARVTMAKMKWDSELEFIDDTGGYGGGVIDCMIQSGNSPVPINFSGKALDSRYLNKRAEMWFLMAEWVKRGGALPYLPELTKELTAPTYTFQNGKFRLEEKALIKERLGFSPDLADALVLTFSLPELPGKSDNPFAIVNQQGKLKSEWNPFAEDRM